MLENVTHVVTIVGNIGSGKTTSLEHVAKALDADIIKADEIFQHSPFRDDFLRDIQRWGFVNELWVAHKRFEHISGSIHRSEKTTVVIDSGLVMSWVYARSHYLSGKMTENEWNLFHALFSSWNKLSIRTTLLYLVAPLDTLLDRIQRRGRGYELELYSRAYLEQIESGLQDLLTNGTGLFDEIVLLGVADIGDIVTSPADQRKFARIIREKLSG